MQELIKVQMLKSLPGSPDGIEVNDYIKGEDYDLPLDLALNFLGQGAAVKVEAPEEQQGKDADGDNELEQIDPETVKQAQVVVDQNATSVIATVGDFDDAEFLRVVLVCEQAGKNRQTVIAAIMDRLVELNQDKPEETKPDGPEEEKTGE